MNRILLLEDDLSLIDGLRYLLQANGFTVTVARTVGQAGALLTEASFDLLLLDVALPDGTGFTLCQALRARGDTTPIIFLTASDEEVSVIRGLDCGGDDYITKPFKTSELLSRIRALLRRAGRGGGDPAAVLHCGDTVIDLLQSRALLRGQPLELTLGEFKLLCLLVRNAGRVVTRARILQALWDQNGCFVDDNTLSVYIRRLREKVERDPSAPAHLLTVRGFGYHWNEVPL